MVTNWQFNHPVKVVSQPLDAFLATLDGHNSVLLVTTAGGRRRGLTARVATRLTCSNLHIFDRVSVNPDINDLNQAISELRQANYDLILAIGGGSVIDTAKTFAASLRLPDEQPLSTLLIDKFAGETHESIPLCAVPTTAGSGSEVTQFATVWNHVKGLKYSLEGRHVFPATAVLDPELTLTLPAEDTMYTGLDAISHAIESLWNIHANPLSIMFAETALDHAAASFSEVMANPASLQGRMGMQLAALFGGYAISITRTALAHAISYPLTARFGIPHGLACSFTLPAIANLVMAANILPERQRQKLAAAIQLLQTLDLPQKMARFTSRKEILQLMPEMFNPSRAANFSLAADATMLESILAASI
ncbi:MAG TPA: phosphonoacetaldehyde reductase [Candidatus Rifleibacterium sp.]|nr:phosphonoacetaldehyde reductase [Candidatus Rifleibacterium sp.]